MREQAIRAVTVEDKALRKAVIDDWCARNGVERIPASREPIPIDELVEISLRNYSWSGRSATIRRP